MPRRIGDHRFQLFVLVTLDKTASRYHVRSTSKQDAIWRVAATGHHVELGRERIQLVVSNVVGVKRTPRIFLELVDPRQNALEHLNLKPWGPWRKSAVFCSNCLQKFVEIRLSCRFDVQAASSSVLP